MAKIYERITKNDDGTRTESVRYSDGSGHDKTYREGVFSNKTVSVTRYPSK